VRAVLDVNALISVLLSSRGAPAQLLRRWLGGEFELVVSEALLAELERALAYPKVRSRISKPDAAMYVLALRQSARMIQDVADPTRRSPDPGDDYLLELAQEARAVLVSGDRHLLDLRDRLPVRSAREFVDLLP
jgi:putative PIN family toxin of toxin-antitoxin system